MSTRTTAGALFVIPSTWDPGEEGVYTLSAMSNSPFTLGLLEPFQGDMYRIKGCWSKKNEGPRGAKNGAKEDGKKFTPQKTWNKNPQFRVWLKNPEDDSVVESVGMQIVLSTPIDGAEIGMHIMRNTYCQFYNEKIEVLADRYQKVVTSTEKHEAANEIAMDITLERQFEVKKNGCEEYASSASNGRSLAPSPTSHGPEMDRLRPAPPSGASPSSSCPPASTRRWTGPSSCLCTLRSLS